MEHRKFVLQFHVIQDVNVPCASIQNNDSHHGDDDEEDYLGEDDDVVAVVDDVEEEEQGAKEQEEENQGSWCGSKSVPNAVCGRHCPSGY